MTLPLSAHWIRECPGLEALTDEQLETFVAKAVTNEFAPGEYIFRQFEPADHLFLLQEGEWIFEQNFENGDRQVLGFSVRGEVVGFGDLTGYAQCARALTGGRALRLPVDDFFQIAATVPSLNQHLNDRRNQVIMEMTQRAAVISNMQAHQCLCFFLLKIAQKQKSEGQGAVLHMTRQDIADYLGLTSDTVSRGFKKLESKGLIALSGSGKQVSFNRPQHIEDCSRGI